MLRIRNRHSRWSAFALTAVLCLAAPAAVGGSYTDDELRIMYRQVQERIGEDRGDPVLAACVQRMQAGDEHALAALFLWLEGRDLVFRLAGESANAVGSARSGELAERLMAQQRHREDPALLRKLTGMQKAFLYCQQFLPQR